jgi:ATP-dependent protease HslVU (ClpYQ) ATPase subunit
MKSQMTDATTLEIEDRIHQAGELYFRLILLVGPGGSGKTKVLRDLAERADAPLVNLNLELSKRLLDVTETQRPLRISKVLDDIVEERPELVLFDNTEVLFDRALKQDPLRLLQQLSRSQTVVSTWRGTIDGAELVYGVPDHPEYRRYPMEGLQVVTTQHQA